jgi:hypothetical protein
VACKCQEPRRHISPTRAKALATQLQAALDAESAPETLVDTFSALTVAAPLSPPPELRRMRTLLF